MIDEVTGAGERYSGVVFRVWGDDQPPRTVRRAGEPEQTSPWVGHRVVSIRALMNETGVALMNSGWARGDDGEVFYPESAKRALSAEIAAMVDAVRERKPDREDDPSKQGRYVLVKAGEDKHGTFYRLERLELA